MRQQAAATGVAVEPLSERLGARIHGADLNALDEGDFAAIETAIWRYHVLSIPGQRLDAEAFLAFSRRFGALEPHPAREFHHPAIPEILILSNETDAAGKPLGLRDGGTYWHSDLAYMAVPAKATILYGITIPAEGGDTLFTDMVAAADDLPPDLRARAEGRRATHDYARRPNRRPTDAPLPEVVHPVLRTHPVTGQQAIYVTPAYTGRVLDLPEGESEALLRDLLAHALQPQYRIRYRWAPGDVVLWDNAAVMHHATTLELPAEQHRTIWRTTVTGTPTY